MAAVSIGTDLAYIPTVYHILCVFKSQLSCSVVADNFPRNSGVFVALAIAHACLCCLATKVIARVQLLFILFNFAYGLSPSLQVSVSL